MRMTGAELEGGSLAAIARVAQLGGCASTAIFVGAVHTCWERLQQRAEIGNARCDYRDALDDLGCECPFPERAGDVVVVEGGSVGELDGGGNDVPLSGQYVQ